jgi:hypothetical protein
MDILFPEEMHKSVVDGPPGCFVNLRFLALSPCQVLRHPGIDRISNRHVDHSVLPAERKDGVLYQEFAVVI